MQKLTLPSATATAATVIPSAPFALPALQGGTASSVDLPTYCRVTATVMPTAASDIGIELWMPIAGWNGKLLGTGNVNWCGGVNQLALALGLREHYATVGTDRGHKSCTADASFAERPGKLAEFGYQSVHEMTSKAKALVAAYYGSAPKHSYFSGGSSGGGEAPGRPLERERQPK